MIIHPTQNFIGVYDSVIDEAQCQSIINYFENLRPYNLVIDSDQYNSKSHLRKDETVFAFHPDIITLPLGSPVLLKFTDEFWKCYEHYCKEFEILRTAAPHGMYMLRIQKTDKGGGFHNFHFENTGCETSNRIVTFMIYLNDVEEGGETEFLYLHSRYKPKIGRLLIWPSTYTHTHRGNPPLSGIKYIMTGWLTYFK